MPFPILKFGDNRQVRKFFYAALVHSLSPTMKEVVSPDEIAHKAAILTGWMKASDSDPNHLRLLCNVINSCDESVSTQEMLELGGDLVLVRTGFYSSSLGKDEAKEYRRIGSALYYRASEFERDAVRKRILALTGVRFTEWQREFRSLEMFFRYQMPLMNTELKLAGSKSSH